MGTFRGFSFWNVFVWRNLGKYSQGKYAFQNLKLLKSMAQNLLGKGVECLSLTISKNCSGQRMPMLFPGYEFDLPTGPSTVMSAEKGAVDSFLLLMNNHMVSQIVKETNWYARQSLLGQGEDPSEWDNKEVTPAEMKAWGG